MKSILTVLLMFGFLNIITGQEDTLKTDGKKDTTRIILGKKEIKIIESQDGTDIKVRDREAKEETKKDFEWNSEKDHEKKHAKKNRDGGFRGHWSGGEIGYNAFFNKDMEMSLYGEDRFMSLNNNPTKSFNLAANFCQKSFALIGDQVGFVTGLRFEFNNYRFDNNNSIGKNAGDTIVPVYYYGDNANTNPLNLDKSKLTCIYFTIPLLFEIQIPHSLKFQKRLWISGGVLASIKIDSHTKVVYHKDGRRQKDKQRDDFNISVLRYGFTGRMGYGNFYVYSNYYPVSFFEKNKGPEVYPFSVGVGFHFD